MNIKITLFIELACFQRSFLVNFQVLLLSLFQGVMTSWTNFQSERLTILLQLLPSKGHSLLISGYYYCPPSKGS